MSVANDGGETERAENANENGDKSVHGWVSNDKLFKSLAPMLKVFAFERTGARVAGRFLIVRVTAHFPFGFAKGTGAVSAGASASVVLVVLIWQVDEHMWFCKRFGGV